MPSAAKWVCSSSLPSSLPVYMSSLHLSTSLLSPPSLPLFHHTEGFQYSSDELSTEDKITICIIESYLDFKVWFVFPWKPSQLVSNFFAPQAGEVWYEVAGELAQEGLRPVTPDQECLTGILQTHEGKAEETLKLQVFTYMNATHLSGCQFFFLFTA